MPVKTSSAMRRDKEPKSPVTTRGMDRTIWQPIIKLDPWTPPQWGAITFSITTNARAINPARIQKNWRADQHSTGMSNQCKARFFHSRCADRYTCKSALCWDRSLLIRFPKPIGILFFLMLSGMLVICIFTRIDASTHSLSLSSPLSKMKLRYGLCYPHLYFDLFININICDKNLLIIPIYRIRIFRCCCCLSLKTF